MKAKAPVPAQDRHPRRHSNNVHFSPHRREELAEAAEHFGEYVAGLRRRRAASHRVPPLACGCRDPWTHKCEPPPIRGYSEAVAHLLAHGLAPAPNVAALQAMWRNGGRDRYLARLVAECWEVAA